MGWVGDWQTVCGGKAQEQEPGTCQQAADARLKRGEPPARQHCAAPSPACTPQADAAARAYHFKSAADDAAEQVRVLELGQRLRQLHKVGQRVVLQDLLKAGGEGGGTGQRSGRQRGCGAEHGGGGSCWGGLDGAWDMAADTQPARRSQ